MLKIILQTDPAAHTMDVPIIIFQQEVCQMEFDHACISGDVYFFVHDNIDLSNITVFHVSLS